MPAENVNYSNLFLEFTINACSFLCPFHPSSHKKYPFIAFFQPFIKSLILYGHKFVCAMPFAHREREKESFTITIILFASVPIGDLRHMNNILQKSCVEVGGWDGLWGGSGAFVDYG
jgi:hypothetical protein